MSGRRIPAIGVAFVVLAAVGPATLEPRPEPGPSASSASLVLGGKSKGLKVSSGASPTQPGRRWRFRSRPRGGGSPPSQPTAQGPLANPLSGMHANRMSGALASSALPQRVAPSAGAGLAGMRAPHGASPFSVTTGGGASGARPPGTGGRNGALAAARAPGTPPAVPPTLALPPVPGRSQAPGAVTGRRAKPYMHEIPADLPRPEPRARVRSPLPRRSGDAAPSESGSSTATTENFQFISYRWISPSSVVYGALPADPGGGAQPPTGRRLSLRAKWRELDADAAAMTGGGGIVVGDPAKGYTPIMAPPVRLPGEPSQASSAPAARPYMLPIPPPPPSYNGGAGRVRAYIQPIPPPPPSSGGAAGASGAAPSLSPARQHAIASYFV